MQENNPAAKEMLGDQGNEGMYGQGQYNSEGKPDPRGAEAQRLKPDTARSGTLGRQGEQEISQSDSSNQQQPQQTTSNQS